jgi:CubicO group peptidase (beta-lactamase class C family)
MLVDRRLPRAPKIDSQNFDNHVEKLMREWKVPGLALAVIDGESTIVKVRGHTKTFALAKADLPRIMASRTWRV